MSEIYAFLYKIFLVLIFSGGGSLLGCATHYKSDNPNGWDSYEWCESAKAPRLPHDCPKIEEVEKRLASGGFQAGSFSDEADNRDFERIKQELREDLGVSE